MNQKLLQLSQKAEEYSFSSDSTRLKSNRYKEIEEALNICSMNVSILRKKLVNEESVFDNNNNDKNAKSSVYSWFTQSKTLTTSTPTISPLLEHCELVLFFLESRIGRISSDLAGHEQRRKEREMLLSRSTYNSNAAYNSTGYGSGMSASAKGTTNNTFINTVNTNKNVDIHSQSHSQQQQQLQLENSRMIEEMSRGLFETLSTTESQILEISRLQSTLQTHLTIQHDQTLRLFEESLSTVTETKKGNEYLRKSGKDGSMMRKFLVSLMLLLSLLLLFLHYYTSR